MRRLPGRQRELIETMVDEPDRSYAEVSANPQVMEAYMGTTEGAH